MKLLKKRSLKAFVGFSIIFWLLIGVMYVLAIPAMVTASGETKDFNELDYTQDVEGTYVSGMLYFIYDWYCETTEDDDVISREYIIDAGEYCYMGMLVKRADMDEAQALVNACYDYMDGYDDGTAIYEAQYEVKGTIRRMPADSLEYYKEYLGWDTMSAEEQAEFLPYYLDVNTAGFIQEGAAYAFFIIGTVILLVWLVLLICILAGALQGQVRKYIAASTNPDMTRERVESFLAASDAKQELIYNEQYICGQMALRTMFKDATQLAWAYKYAVAHKRYFITVSKSYYLMLGFTDGKFSQISMKNEATVDKYVNELQAYYPRIIAGYTDELAKMFRKNREEFLEIRYYAADNASMNVNDMGESL